MRDGPTNAAASRVETTEAVGAGRRPPLRHPRRLTWRATMNDGRLDVQGGGPLQRGDIMLMHFRPDLRQNLEVALDAARAAGLQPAPLEDYLTPA